MLGPSNPACREYRIRISKQIERRGGGERKEWRGSHGLEAPQRLKFDIPNLEFKGLS